jgi:hypothetical protein
MTSEPVKDHGHKRIGVFTASTNNVGFMAVLVRKSMEVKGENVMKRIAVLVITTMLTAISGFAADQTWTGKISDSMCGASHKKVAEHGTANISDHDCTLACVKNGGKYVFVRNGKVYSIENQDYAGLEAHAGEAVRLTGEMNGDTIKVSNIEPSGHSRKG